MAQGNNNKIVPIEVECVPEDSIQIRNAQNDVTKDNPKHTFSFIKDNIIVTIRTREDLCLQKNGLDC